MPIILTVDGPSLGGFVCPATTILADMWKWGHVRPGDSVTFELTTLQEAYALRQQQDARVRAVHDAAVAGKSVHASEVRHTAGKNQSLCAACRSPADTAPISQP